MEPNSQLSLTETNHFLTLQVCCEYRKEEKRERKECLLIFSTSNLRLVGVGQRQRDEDGLLSEQRLWGQKGEAPIHQSPCYGPYTLFTSPLHSTPPYLIKKSVNFDDFLVRNGGVLVNGEKGWWKKLPINLGDLFGFSEPQLTLGTFT